MNWDGRDGRDVRPVTDEMSMWEDPSESSAMRQLLRSGRVEHSDYDVESGLARHLAQLQAGAPLPAWAVQTTLQKSASWSILAWLLPPMISAGVVGAWLAIRPADPAPTTLVNVPPTAAAQYVPQLAAAQPSEAPVAASAPVAEPTSNSLANAADALNANQDRDVQGVQGVQGVSERHEHHNGLARNARVATRASNARASNTRAINTRRGDESGVGANYAVAAQSSRDSSGVGSGAGLASSSSRNEADEPVALAANTVAKQAVAPVNEPVPAPAEDKAKERRAKTGERDGESAKLDEVSGARLEREMRMLAVAQRVLTEDPARSLRLCRQGENEFRGSMFSAERKQVALLALVQLGKVEQARREGIPFLRAFPNAPWSARLREALSTGRLPSP